MKDNVIQFPLKNKVVESKNQVVVNNTSEELSTYELQQIRKEYFDYCQRFIEDSRDNGSVIVIIAVQPDDDDTSISSIQPGYLSSRDLIGIYELAKLSVFSTESAGGFSLPANEYTDE